jgi:predicted RecA/RadA family phage recombinase
MSLEANLIHEAGTVRETIDARVLGSGTTLASGQVVQTSDGRAGVVAGLDLNVMTTGEKVTIYTRGVFEMAANPSCIMVRGQRVYWDATNNRVSYTGDFFVGVTLADKTSTGTTVLVDLNVDPVGLIDLRNPTNTFATVTSTGTVTQLGQAISLALTTAGSAQHAWFVSDVEIDIDDGPVLEFWFNLATAADNAVADIDVGFAAAAGTTDFEGTDYFISIHNDGNDLNLDVQSDDGTTDTAAVDTGVDLVAGTPIHVIIDCRVKTAPKIYVNGAAVTQTAITLAAYTSTLAFAACIEKSGTDDSPGAIEIYGIRAWTDLR